MPFGDFLVLETTDEFTGTIRAFHPHGSLLPNEEFPLEYSLLVCALGSIESLGGNKSRLFRYSGRLVLGGSP